MNANYELTGELLSHWDVLAKSVPPLGSTNMDWQIRLVTFYVFVCDHFAQGLWTHAQCFAPYVDLGFTDEEVVTVYLAGILDKNVKFGRSTIMSATIGLTGSPTSSATGLYAAPESAGRSYSPRSWSGHAPRGRRRPTSVGSIPNL